MRKRAYLNNFNKKYKEIRPNKIDLNFNKTISNIIITIININYNKTDKCRLNTRSNMLTDTDRTLES